MRILYLESHPMFTYGLPKGFQELGHDVELSGPLTEECFVSKLSEFKPDVVLAVGWTGLVSFITVQSWIGKCLHEFNIPYVYWATEDPGYMEQVTLPIIREGKPDYIFTVCPQNVEKYKSMGIKASYLDFGYNPEIHTPVPCQDKYRTTIAVVANGYSQLYKEQPGHLRFVLLRQLVKPLLHSGYRIDFYGHDWDHGTSIFDFSIPVEWYHGYLNYTEANKVYSSADLVIGLQNRSNQLTQRTFEVLASGGFLLTGDTPAVRNTFTPSEDLIVSSSAEETIRLVEYYLKNKDKRIQIQAQGKKSVAEHSYKNRAGYVLKVLHEHHILT